jgi:L-asparaginase II
MTDPSPCCRPVPAASAAPVLPAASAAPVLPAASAAPVLPAVSAAPVLPAASAAPVLIDVWRGALVESRHRARAVVADARGRVVAAWGDPEAPIYPRSAVKALQALPLVETGALDAFGLGERELALACGSHHGEPYHIDLARRWLERIGLEPAALACGAHPPFDEGAAAALIRAGLPATVLHNNCSGKHLGLLTTARHGGDPVEGYSQPGHPVQRRIAAVLEAMTGAALATAPVAVDGCGVPTWGLPLVGLATAMARFADPGGLPPARAAAVLRVREAWGRHPELIGGETSFDTRMMRETGGAVLIKSGGEGVGVAVLKDRALGIALKIEDGTPRAKNVAMAALLRRFGVGVPDGLAQPAVTNWAGRTVGAIRPTAGWPE